VKKHEHRHDANDGELLQFSFESRLRALTHVDMVQVALSHAADNTQKQDTEVRLHEEDNSQSPGCEDSLPLRDNVVRVVHWCEFSSVGPLTGYGRKDQLCGANVQRDPNVLNQATNSRKVDRKGDGNVTHHGNPTNQV
jgi:hypothetical protein